jgi:hypothetical protein
MMSEDGGLASWALGGLRVSLVWNLHHDLPPQLFRRRWRQCQARTTHVEMGEGKKRQWTARLEMRKKLRDDRKNMQKVAVVGSEMEKEYGRCKGGKKQKIAAGLGMGGNWD